MASNGEKKRIAKQKKIDSDQNKLNKANAHSASDLERNKQKAFKDKVISFAVGAFIVFLILAFLLK